MYHCLIDNKSFGNERSLINYIKKKYDLNYVTYQINNNLLDSNDYIRCEICGQYCKVLKNHISSNHKGIIFDDYVIKYSPIKTVCESTLKILADNMKGENNPNHTSNCSLLKRRENSPLCKEFWLLRGGDDKSSETLEKAKNNRSYTSRLDYWLSRSNDLEHAKTLLKERQSTFSLKNCISKYGDAGLNVWNNRQTKWLKSLHINGNLKLGYSKISQELFNSLPISNNVYYATKNKEFSLYNGDKLYLYDYVDYDKKKIIEYNGDRFHANPNIYDSNDCPNPFNNNLKSFDIWKYDSEKLEHAKSYGYEILIVWDSEYKQDKSFVVNTCILFLKSVSL